jgi:choline-glycine betaine transporter
VVGAVVDGLCLLAIAGGVAAVLGVGTMQISSGIQIMTGIPATKTMWGGVVGAIVVTYIISSYTGLNRGIRWLSDWNAKIFLALLVFVFVFDRPGSFSPFGTQAVGHFLDDFFVRTTI